MQGTMKFWKRLVFASGLGLVLLSVSLAEAQAAPTTQPQPVVVTNTASQPVPVTGSVAAAQSGSWTVGISGTPTVNVSGSTVVAFDDSRSYPANTSQFFGPIDVSAYKQIRIAVGAQDTLADPTFQVRVYTSGPNNTYCLLDDLQGSLSSGGVTKAYDVPGRSIYLSVFSPTGAIFIEATVWGRTN